MVRSICPPFQEQPTLADGQARLDVIPLDLDFQGKGPCYAHGALIAWNPEDWQRQWGNKLSECYKTGSNPPLLKRYRDDQA